jgi:hypothetical protein
MLNPANPNQQSVKPPSLRGRSDHIAKRGDPGGGYGSVSATVTGVASVFAGLSGIEIPPFCLAALMRVEASSPSRGADCVFQLVRNPE